MAPTIPLHNRHLAKLPKKSYKVAPGDLIGCPVEVNGRMRLGGTIYVDDKRLGIEAGHMGISIDSVPYRNFIKDQIALLQEGIHDNHAMQNRFNRLKKINYDFYQLAKLKKISGEPLEDLVDLMIGDSVHKKINKERVNVGIGGLIFKDYLKYIHINDNDNHFVKMAKLTQEYDKNGHVILDDEGKPKPLNDVYMFKGDNILSLGRAGPNLDRVRQTERREWGHLLSRKYLARTLGLSAVGYYAIGLIWRANIMKNTSTLSASTDAVVENVANKMAELRGIRSQSIDTVEGTFENGDPKIIPVVKWSTGFSDLSGKIAGNEDSWDSVIVKFKNKHPVKVDNNGHLLFVKIDEEQNKTYWKQLPNTSQKETPCTEQEYAQGLMVSDDSILGLGEALVGMISMGDRDKFGKQGQNMGIMPINPPQGQYTHQLYGIDYGKSYENDNTIIGTLKDDFSFDNPNGGRNKLVNYSIMYDNPLRNKMKGVYMLAVLRGAIDDQRKMEIAKQYETAGDYSFSQRLRDYPSALEHDLLEKLAPNDPEKAAAVKKAIKKNGDLYLIAIEQMKYRELANDSSLPKKVRKNYRAFAEQLGIVYKRALKNDNVVLQKFEKRLKLNPEHIDLLDKFEKITAKKAYDATSDGKVKLNHLRVENADRTEWQIELNPDDTFNLICTETDKKHKNEIIIKLQKLLEIQEIKNDDSIRSLLQSALSGKLLKIENITKKQLELMNAKIHEKQAASIHNLNPLILWKNETTVTPVHQVSIKNQPQNNIESIRNDQKNNRKSPYLPNLPCQMQNNASLDELSGRQESIIMDNFSTKNSLTQELPDEFNKMKTAVTAAFQSKSDWDVYQPKTNTLAIQNKENPEKSLKIKSKQDTIVLKQKGGAYKEMVETIHVFTREEDFIKNHPCTLRAKDEQTAEKFIRQLTNNGLDLNIISYVNINGLVLDNTQRESLFNKVLMERNNSILPSISR